jgi:hypothetical protein
MTEDEQYEMLSCDKVRLLCELRHVIPCVGNPAEQESCVSTLEFSTGV